MRPINYITTHLWRHSLSDVDIPEVPRWLKTSHHANEFRQCQGRTDCSPIALLLAPWSAKFYDTVYTRELFIFTEIKTDCSGILYSNSLMSLSNVDSENWNLQTVSITLIIIGCSVSSKLMERRARRPLQLLYMGIAALRALWGGEGGKWSLMV